MSNLTAEQFIQEATPLKLRRNGYGTPEHSARNNI